MSEERTVPFEPEFGQAILSNGECFSFEMQRFVERGLEDLGEMIQDGWLSDNGYREGANPTSNSGGEFMSDKFAIRAYCWCDGELHPQGCPPNFEHFSSGFLVSWYKNLGRGSSQNKILNRAEWQKIYSECCNSIKNTPPIPKEKRFWREQQKGKMKEGV